MDYNYDLISIGSGSAGRRVAVALKNAGWNTAIVEKDVEHHFGGTCICSGCIPTKAMVEKSLQTDDFEKIKAHKEMIVDRIRSGTLRHVEERVEADVIRGFATFLDDHTIEVEGKQYTAEIIVIATGSRELIPPIKGIETVDYKTSYSFLNLENVPGRLLIIGGGRIGLEFGTLYHRLGAEVTIFEGMDQLLPGEDTEVAKAIEDLLKTQGVNIATGQFVDEVRQVEGADGTEFQVFLNKGKYAGTYTGDLLLVATGRIPNIEGLNLQNIGVTVQNQAIEVNEFMQTSVDHIYAIGDVVGNPMFTNWASWQSGTLLNNLKKSRTLSDEWQPLRRPNIPRICFIEPEYAATGMTEAEAREKFGDEVVTFNFMNKWLGKSMIVDDWDGFLKGIGRKGSNEILGVHLWGKRAGSLIQLVIFAMDHDMGWKELNDMVYGHPVLVEGIYSLSASMKGRVGI